MKLSTPSSADIKNEWLHIFIMAINLRGVCRDKFNFYKTVEVCQVTLIELMCVDRNDVSTGIHYFLWHVLRIEF